ADGLGRAGGGDSGPAATGAVERARRVVEHLGGDEGHAVPAREEEALRPAPARLLREVQDLRHVGEVIQREADGGWLEAVQLGEVVARSEDLKVEEPHLVPG